MFFNHKAVKIWKHIALNGYILDVYRLTYGYFITIIMLTDVLVFHKEVLL